MNREEAKKQVKELKGFYRHLYSYIAINIILIIINLVTSPRNLWFYWVTIFWGLALILQAFRVFGKNRIIGKDWEDRKIKEIMEKNSEKDKSEKE